MDLLKASLKSDLSQMQADIDARHHHLYTEAVNLARSVSVEPSMPSIVHRQVYRANAPAPTPEDYYKINLTSVFLDHSLQQLNARFQDEVYLYYKGLSIIPSVLLVNNLNWRQNVQEFCDYYRQDIPNAAGLDAELHLWERMWRDQQARQADIPDRISETLKLVDKQAFVNIFTILQILATVPISSSSCERSISTLKNLTHPVCIARSRSTLFIHHFQGPRKSKFYHLDIPSSISTIYRRYLGPVSSGIIFIVSKLSL